MCAYQQPWLRLVTAQASCTCVDIVSEYSNISTTAILHDCRAKCARLWPPGVLVVSARPSGVLPRAKYMGACRSFGCTL